MGQPKANQSSGRPPKVTKFWKKNGRIEKLARLYFFSTLSLEKICERVAKSTDSEGIGKKRSLQNLLRSFLGPRFFELRPKSRDMMRRRVALLRRARRRHELRISSREVAAHKNGTVSHGSPMPSTTFSQKSQSGSLTMQRLSDSPLHSMESDISFISTMSNVSFTLSSECSTEKIVNPEPVSGGFSSMKDFNIHHAFLVNSCCQDSTGSATCIHWKAAFIVSDIDAISDISTQDLDEVDIFGDGILHIAARYGASFDVLEQLLALGPLSNCANLTNFYGESFMHLLNPSWLTDKVHSFHQLLTMGCHHGFRHDSRDRNGHTFLAVLLAQDRLRSLSTDQLLDALETILKGDEHWLNFSLQCQTYGWPRLIDCLKGSIESVERRYEVFPTNLGRCEDIKERLRVLENAISELPGHPISLHQLLVPREGASTAMGPVSERLQAGDDPNNYDETGHTCLMGVVQNMSTAKISPGDGEELLKLLLGAGADIRKRDLVGNTVLHHAASLGEHTIFDILRHHKVDINIRNEQGAKPLDLAADALLRNPRCSILAPKLYKVFHSAELAMS